MIKASHDGSDRRDDSDDDDRTLFTLRAFDGGMAKLTMDTLVSPSDIGLLCACFNRPWTGWNWRLSNGG